MAWLQVAGSAVSVPQVASATQTLDTAQVASVPVALLKLPVLGDGDGLDLGPQTSGYQSSCQ